MARGKKRKAEDKVVEEKQIPEEDKEPSFTDYFVFNDEVALAVKENRVLKMQNGAWRVYKK